MNGAHGASPRTQEQRKITALGYRCAGYFGHPREFAPLEWAVLATLALHSKHGQSTERTRVGQVTEVQSSQHGTLGSDASSD